MQKTYSLNSFYKRILQNEYNRRYRAKNPEKFKKYIKLQMRKWRSANPKKAKELGRKHQHTWRTKYPEVNRYRARIGMRAHRIYNDLLKLMKG